MNAEIITAISKLGSYALALGVLVWALHTWNVERQAQMQIEEKYRGILVQTVRETLGQLNDDRDETRELMRLLLDHFAKEQEVNKHLITQLSSIEDRIEIQTKSVTGKLKSLQ